MIENIICDFYNAGINKSEGTILKIHEAKLIINSSFGVDEEKIKTLTEIGMSRDETILDVTNFVSHII